MLRWSGLPALIRATGQRSKVTILFYHDIDPAALSRHLSVLGKRYRFIGLREYVEARRSGSTAALPRRALIVTLDDGTVSQFQLLDVFRKHSVVPTIFLTSGIVGSHRGFWWTMVPGGRAEVDRLKTVPDSDRVAELASSGRSETDTFADRSALSRIEIETMRGSVEFQSHTVLHPILSRCSDPRAWDEIARSKSELEGEFGLNIYALAYPNGKPADYGEREVTFATRAGYVCAVTTVPGMNDDRTDLFRLRRISISDDASRDEIIVKASLLNGYLNRLLPTRYRAGRAT